jgi:hypothetical protein
MSKKSFKGGLDSLLGEHTAEEAMLRESFKKVRPKGGRPKTSHKKDEKASERGCKEGDERFTVIFKKALMEKVKDLAYWERSQIKDIVNSALDEYLSKYEKKNGPIKKRGK